MDNKHSIKLRVRFKSQTRVIEVLSSDTISNIKSIISDIFDTLSDTFAVSLDKCTSLDDSSTSNDLGLVSGDLVYVIDDASTLTAASRPIHANTGSVSDSASSLQSTSMSHTSTTMDITETETIVPTVSAVTEATMGSSKCRPNTLRQVSNTGPCPITLKELIILNRTKVHNSFSAAVLPLHAVMLESGFSRVVQSKNVGLLEDCLRGGVFTAYYEIDKSSSTVGFEDEIDETAAMDLKYVITCVPIGNRMIVNASFTWNRVEESPVKALKMNPSEYINNLSGDADDLFKNLSRFYHIFKCNIVNWMIRTISPSKPLTLTLDTLPSELQTMILSRLDFRSRLRLSRVNKKLQRVVRDDNLGWKRLYLKDHGNTDDNQVSHNWLQLYRDQHIRKCGQRRLRESRLLEDRSSHFIDPITPTPGYHGLPRNPFAPGMHPGNNMGIIGGEYDLRPQMPEFGGVGRLGMRPRYDPRLPFNPRPRPPRNPDMDPDGPYGGEWYM